MVKTRPKIEKKAIEMLGDNNINMIHLTLMAHSCFPDYGQESPRTIIFEETLINIIADVYGITKLLGEIVSKDWEESGCMDLSGYRPNYKPYAEIVANMIWESAYSTAQKSEEEQNNFKFGDTEIQKRRITEFVLRFKTLLNNWFDMNSSYGVYKVWEQIRELVFDICLKGVHP